MAKFGYKLMTETTGPKDLVRNASGLSPPRGCACESAVRAPPLQLARGSAARTGE